MGTHIYMHEASYHHIPLNVSLVYSDDVIAFYTPFYTSKQSRSLLCLNLKEAQP